MKIIILSPFWGIFLTCLSVLFTGCYANTEDVYYLGLRNTGHSIILPRAKLTKLKTIGDGSLVSFLDNYANVIYIYDYNKGILTDSIDVSLREMQYLFDYEVIDSNRFLLSIIPTYLGNMHDSATCLIDKKKNILGVFSFNNTPAPIYNIDSPLAYKQKIWWYTKHSNFPIRFSHKDSTVITVLAPFRKLTCDSITKLSEHHFAYKLSIKKNADALPLPYKIPQCSDYYDKNVVDMETAAYGDYSSLNIPVMGYSHSNELFYNNKSYKPKLHIYAQLDKHNISLNYKRLVYDKFRDCFWWVIKISSKDGTHKDVNINYQNYYLVQLNPNLEVVSEGFLPKYYDQYIIPLKSGLLVKNSFISDSLGKNYYTIFEPISSNNLLPIESEIVNRQENVKQDFSKFITSIDSKPLVGKKYLIVSLDLMPPNYAKLLKEMLVELNGAYKGYDIHIFTDNPEIIPIEIKNHAHIRRYSDLTRHINKFIWPKIIEVKNIQPLSLDIQEYPSSSASSLASFFYDK